MPGIGPSAAALTISGTGLRSGITVRVGGLAATVTSTTSYAIVATAPARAAGPADVVVTNPGGETVTLAGAFTYVPLTVTSLETPIGFAGIRLRMLGSGFLPATSVTFGSVPANTTAVTNASMLVTIPIHAIGTVEVVATNPGGERATLVGGFTYAIPPVLNLDRTTVMAGGLVNVSWTATTTWGLDWVGLYKAGDRNEDWLKYFYTGGHTSCNTPVTMPAEPGQYEFRYLPNDSYVDIAKSNPVTVTPATDAVGGARRMSR